MPPMNFDDELWFGKYKGVTFREVFKINPGYLTWALKSGAIRQIEMPPEITGEAGKRLDEQDAHELQLAAEYGSKDDAHEVSRSLGDIPTDPFPARNDGDWTFRFAQQAQIKRWKERNKTTR